MYSRIIPVDEYTPCRITEIYLEQDEEIEVITSEGMFRLKGIPRKIWLMLDGKHTVGCIVDQLCFEFGVDKDSRDEIRKKVISTLNRLTEMKAIIANWDPLYKFDISQELI